MSSLSDQLDQTALHFVGNFCPSCSEFCIDSKGQCSGLGGGLRPGTDSAHPGGFLGYLVSLTISQLHLPPRVIVRIKGGEEL